MAGAYPSSVTASQVGSYFVQQYYQVLQQQPDFVHQFYTDSSTMVRVDGDSTETASAILQIHTLIQSLHFSGIEIKTINSLESWSEGVIVVVSGSVRSKNFSGWRKFVQTFFLAPQVKGYFVMNDIFHFVDEEFNHHHQPPVVPENKIDSQPISSAPELPVSEDALEVEARENLDSIHLEGDDQDDYYTYQEHQHQPQEDHDSEGHDYEEEPPIKETSSLVQNPVDYVQEPMHQNAVDYIQEPMHQTPVDHVQEPIPAVKEPIAEPVKFTYASILQSKARSVPSVPAQPSIRKSVSPAREWHQTPETIAQQPAIVPETTAQMAEKPSANEEGESKSVYVRNLPTNVTSLEILQEFKNFGRIKQDGVFLKNRKDVGVCFAFVEFEDIGSVQKAVEASPIQLAGRQVYIEERRASSGGGSRSGRGRGGGRGRESYHDASRGRYARGSYQDGRGNDFRGI